METAHADTLMRIVIDAATQWPTPSEALEAQAVCSGCIAAVAADTAIPGVFQHMETKDNYTYEQGLVDTMATGIVVGYLLAQERRGE